MKTCCTSYATSMLHTVQHDFILYSLKSVSYPFFYSVSPNTQFYTVEDTYFFFPFVVGFPSNWFASWVNDLACSAASRANSRFSSAASCSTTH